MSSLPFQLVGRLDDADGRLVVQLELDARTGEILSISGDHDAIRRTCSIARAAVDAETDSQAPTRQKSSQRSPQQSPQQSPQKNSSPAKSPATMLGLTSTARLSDDEARDLARPSNILAALRRTSPRTPLRLSDKA